MHPLLLSLLIAFYVLLMWEVSVSMIGHLQNHLPLSKLNSASWQVVLLIGLRFVSGISGGKIQRQTNIKLSRPVSGGVGDNKFSRRRIFLGKSVFPAHYAYFAVNVFAVHLKKLWLIDSELTDKLVELASESHRSKYVRRMCGSKAV